MKYILVYWPDSQILMEQDWFNLCFLANPANEEQNWVGSSAYFVPENKYQELYSPKTT